MAQEDGVRGEGHDHMGRVGGQLSRVIASPLGYALTFAVLFGLAWIPVLAVLGASGYSFFWNIDGLSQQYVWFVYTGQWIRDVLGSLIGGEGLNVPLWTMDSGFGVDTVQAFVCTVVNPFYAVSALVPERWAEQVFEAMLVLQAYCAGLTFSLWSIRHGEPRSSTLVGAIAYVFAGNMTAIFLQPGFLFPAMVFPLALYGADRVFAGRSPLPFIAVMAWVFAFSFYDAYMICVMLVLYCLAMFFGRVEKVTRGRLRWIRLAGWTGRFVLYILLSVAIAAVLFLPQAIAVVGQERLDVQRAEEILYAPTYYIKLLMGFTCYSFAGGDAYTGWSPLAVPILLLLIMRCRRHPALFWSFVVLAVMLCVPFFGSLMNAFQYPTARWAWACSAFVSLAIARLLPELLSMNKVEKCVIGGFCALYLVCVLILPVSQVVTLEAILMACMVAVCIFGSVLGYRLAVCCIALLTTAAGGTCFSYYPLLIDSYAPAGSLWSTHGEQGVAGAISEARDRGVFDGGYRYDRTVDRTFVQNSNLIIGSMGTNFYNSMYNDGVDALLRSLGNPATHGANHRFDSLGEQSYIQTLLGVRYLFASDMAAERVSPLMKGEVLSRRWDGTLYESPIALPLAFSQSSYITKEQYLSLSLLERQEAMKGEVLSRRWDGTLYESPIALPLAFSQSSYITKEQYLSLSLLERQEALLQAVVLDSDADVSGVENSFNSLVFESSEIPYTAELQGCEWDGRHIRVTHPGASIVFTFDSLPKSETFLCIQGMDYRDFKASDYVSDGEWESMGLGGKAMLLARETKDNVMAKRSRTTSAYIDVSSPLGSQMLAYPNAEDPMFGGPRDWACNLGYSDTGITSATITFQTQGLYTFDEIGIACLPTALLERQAAVLRGHTAQDIRIECNEISCTATLEEDGLLFFSVAFSRGWKAFVDGREVEPMRADLGFMALPLDRGTHEVRLAYETPYLKEGVVISLLGLAATGALLLVRKRRLGDGRGGSSQDAATA